MSRLTPVAAFELRAHMKKAIRSFFGARGFLEVDTPVGVVMPGTEVHLGYFKTEWRDFKGTPHPLYLRSSPEIHLKQALALGVPKVFQLATCFRNGGELSDWHHPEFTMLEWYQAGLTFEAFVEQTEALLRETHAEMAPVAERHGLTPLKLPAFPRITVAEAFKRWAGLELLDDDAELGAKAKRAGVFSAREDDDFETAFFKVLLDKVEPALETLGGAVLLDYPPSQAALATVRGGVAKRCEFYVGRVELSNGFEELLDEDANRKRIQAANARRQAMGVDVPEEDEKFYEALGNGLPQSCGNALGFDRWLALCCGLRGIAPVIPFRDARPYER